MKDICRKAYDNVSMKKQVVDGSVLYLQTTDTERKLTVTVKGGKPYIG